MPRADDLPNFTVGTEITLCTHNPLGVEGLRRGRRDRLAAGDHQRRRRRAEGLGVRHIDMPATPQKLWSIIGRRK